MVTTVTRAPHRQGSTGITPDALPTSKGEWVPRSTAGSARRRALAIALMLLVLMTSACASVSSGSTQPSGGDDDDADAGPPQYGGKMIYGLEAETTNGWCLPEGQLAIAGIQVARTIYDTLTVPDGDGGFDPFLAESITPSPDYTQWMIHLREGITFHDGTALDATVVKNNIDAFWGKYPARALACCSSSCSATSRRPGSPTRCTVVVTTKRPVGLVPVVPLLVGPLRHLGAGPARRRRELRQEHDRHRPLPAEGVAGQRPPDRHPQRELLAQGRGRQPAAVPRRDRVPAHPRASSSGSTASSPARSTRSTSPATPGR